MLKKLLKRFVRPAAAPLYVRVDALMQPKLDQLNERIEQLSIAHHGTAVTAASAASDAAALSTHLPAVLNAISSQNAIARESRRNEHALKEMLTSLASGVAELDRRLGEWSARDQVHLQNLGRDLASLSQVLHERIATVERRGEFIRKELMLEVRYGGRSSGLEPGVEAKIVNPEKLDGDVLRLNVGSGHIQLDDFVNVDGRALDGIDVVADARQLPFDPDSVDVIRSAHLLEHFPSDELELVVLPHWRALLKPGGTLSAIVPDAEATISAYVDGTITFDELRTVTFGDQEYEGDFHFTMFSRQGLVDALERAGFRDVQVIEAGRRNGLCYEMEFSARKPETSSGKDPA
jgi:predicted SAM-dependent methyltransferase